MKKILTITLILLVLVGCNSEETKAQKEQLSQYETYWNSLLNESQFQSSSRNFDIEVEFKKTGSHFEYYVIIDNPKIAMYDVEVLVIENRESFDGFDKMLPSVGIFDEPVNLIPNQIRTEKNFREGIALSRQELNDDEVTIQVMVVWKNYTKLDSFKEVFEFDLSEIE